MKQWYKDRKKDHFYLKAKKNSVISRAYYKLEEIDKKHKLFSNTVNVLDIGCSPGGWSQYILNTKKNSKVVGIDILEMQIDLGSQFEFYHQDLNKYLDLKKLFEEKNYQFDSIISDIAPNTSGNQFIDQVKSYELSYLSFQFIDDFLNPNGSFLVKNFQGEDTQKLFNLIKSKFKKSLYVKPLASDKKSKEIYILGLEKK